MSTNVPPAASSPFHGAPVVDNFNIITAGERDPALMEDIYYLQPGALFRLLLPEERQRLFDNTARALTGTKESVKERRVRNCSLADPEYVTRVAAALEWQALASPNGMFNFI